MKNERVKIIEVGKRFIVTIDNKAYPLKHKSNAEAVKQVVEERLKSKDGSIYYQ